MNTEKSDGADDTLMSALLAWRKKEVEIIKQAQAEARNPRNLIPAEEIWKKFGL